MVRCVNMCSGFRERCKRFMSNRRSDWNISSMKNGLIRPLLNRSMNGGVSKNELSDFPTVFQRRNWTGSCDIPDRPSRIWQSPPFRDKIFHGLLQSSESGFHLQALKWDTPYQCSSWFEATSFQFNVYILSIICIGRCTTTAGLAHHVERRANCWSYLGRDPLCVEQRGSIK